MSTSDSSKRYSKAPQPGNPRATEAWALSQAALRLKLAREGADRQQILDAVRLNWRLWTIFQADLMDPQCSVPPDIRMNVLSLARFIDRQSVEILSAPDPEGLDVLIGINRELAAGMFTAVPASDHAAGSTAASANLRIDT